jgi:hypothetical protein
VELLSAFAFAPRFGAVVGPLTFLLVLVGIGVRRLVFSASLAVATVPLLYLASPASRAGGSAFSFSVDHLAAHWIAAGATCAMLGAGFLQARGIRASATARGESRSRVTHTAGGQREATAPRQQALTMRATGSGE